jgi:CO/xanthine dehydrogenase Mo-binding subunit
MRSQESGGAGDRGQSLRGDPKQALESAAIRMEEIYSTPFHTHSPMEPHATIAVWEGVATESKWLACSGSSWRTSG